MNFFSKRRRVANPPFGSSGRRPHRYRPDASLMGLESRQLLAAGPLGINLETSMGYVDQMKENAGWTGIGSTPLTFDANGWPLSDASVLVFDKRVNQAWNGPDPAAVQPDIGGTYHLSFSGRATVTPNWIQNYVVQNQVYNAATNTTTADLVVTHNSLGMLYIDFEDTVNPSSPTGAGVSNVRVIAPGYAADTTQVFTTEMLNALKPFSTIRYLNVDAANDFAPTYDSAGKLIPLNWSQRKLPSASSQTTGPGAAGQAWEYMVALANASNTDLWINVPGPATDDYVKQLANLIKNGSTVNGVTYAGLKPGLKVYLELSNEVWGGIAAPTAYNLAAAKQEVAAGGSVLNADGATDPNVWSQRYYLERSMQIVNDFRSVFGADSSYATLRPVLGWQEGVTSYYTTNFPWFEKNFGAPNAYFYGMGGANYAFATNFSTVDEMFNSLYASLAEEASTASALTTLATYYGMKNVAYEGGPQTSYNYDPHLASVSLAAARDPRMQDLELKFYQTWYAAGGDLAMVYSGPFNTYSPFNQFALAESSQFGNPMASPKYRGMVDLSQAAPTPVVAGTAVSPAGVTNLPTQSDSLARPAAAPLAGQTNIWLVNVPAAGTYTLTIQAAASWTNGQVAVSTSDSSPPVTYSFGKAAGSYNVANLTLRAGLNSIAIATLSNRTINGLTMTPTLGTTVLDPSFDTAGLYAGAFTYGPAGTPWSFAGPAGVTSNGSALSGATAAPTGSTAAFVQTNGSVSQVVNLAAAGYYQVGFAAAQRAGYGTQRLQVIVDGAIVGTYAPADSSYKSFTTPTLLLSAGPHTITFQGTVTSSDVSAFLDDVKLTAAPAAAVVADPSFEALGLGAGVSMSSFVYNPTGTPWAFNGSAGLTSSNTTFTSGSPAAPQGINVAFIQNQGSASQVVANWAAGSYTISFSAAQRANQGPTSQTIQVLVDGKVVGTFTPSGASYQGFTTASFTVAAGSHTITFQGMNTNGDGTALIDGATIAQVASATSPFALLDPGFETLGLPVGWYIYGPKGTPWTFSGPSGTSANSSAFTGGNPAAPQGTQVAFLQNTGAVSQVVANWAAGSYTISFSAAQRGSWGAPRQTIQVLVDGTAVGTFTPSGASYQGFTTASFTVAAGSHTITFQGMNAVGDNTAFLDAVAINPANATGTSGPGGQGIQDGPSSPATMGDSGFEAVSAGGDGRYIYGPTGGTWTFAGTSGLTANYSGFTIGNPTAPQGSQVAFVQNTGAISQTVSGTTAGNYVIRLKAAQRANAGGKQTLQVLLDGVVLSTFTDLSSSYTTLTTAAFALPAGPHKVTVRGVNASGDATAFLDDVSLIAQ